MVERKKGYKGDLNRQYVFDIEGNIFAPQTIEQITGFPGILSVIKEQKLMKDCPEGPLMTYNFQSGKGHILPNLEGVSEYPFVGPAPSIKNKLSACLFTFPCWKNQKEFFEFLKYLSKKLKPSSPVFAIDLLPSLGIQSSEKVWKKDTWKRLTGKSDFVKADTISKNGFLLFRAAVPKERKGVNLVESWANSGVYWKENFIKNMLAKNKKEYLNHR